MKSVKPYDEDFKSHVVTLCRRFDSIPRTLRALRKAGYERIPTPKAVKKWIQQYPRQEEIINKESIKIIVKVETPASSLLNKMLLSDLTQKEKIDWIISHSTNAKIIKAEV